MSANLLATLLQFGFCALVFVAARGARLGPPRPAPRTRHRSALEYVRAMALLTQSARVEDELLPGLRRDLRLYLAERLGIPVAVPTFEAAREAERLTGVPAGDVELLLTGHDFLAVSKRLAALQARVEGRAAR